MCKDTVCVKRKMRAGREEAIMLKDCGSGIIRKLFLNTFITMLMIELANAVSCLADGLIVSRFLSTEEIAAFGLCAPYFRIATAVSGVLTVGGQTLCSRSLGAGNREEANRIFTVVITLAILLSSALSVVGFLFSDAFAILFGARGSSAELLPYTAAYVKWVFIGTPAWVLTLVLIPFAQLDGKRHLAERASIVLAAADIILNLLFVLVFKMGIAGVALSTSLSDYLSLVSILPHFIRGGSLFKTDFRRIRWSLTGKIIGKGLPKGIRSLCTIIAPILINGYVLSFGGISAMAAMSVRSNVATCVTIFPVGIGSAVLLLSGLYVGEENKDALGDILHSMLRYAAIPIAGLAALMILFADAIAGIYVPDIIAVRQMTAVAIRWFAVSLPLSAVSYGLTNYLNALGRQTGTYLMYLSTEFFCLVGSAAVLGSLFGLNGVFAAYPAAHLLTILIYCIAAALRKNTPLRERNLFYRKDFGVGDADRFGFRVGTVKDAVELSERIEAFARSHGLPPRECYLAALCAEEMASNAVIHGFRDGKKHSMDVYVICRDGRLTMNFRDDCPQFDLRKRAEQLASDRVDPEKNIGIRIVMNAAREVDVSSVLNTNNVRIMI